MWNLRPAITLTNTRSSCRPTLKMINPRMNNQRKAVLFTVGTSESTKSWVWRMSPTQTKKKDNTPKTTTLVWCSPVRDNLHQVLWELSKKQLTTKKRRKKRRTTIASTENKTATRSLTSMVQTSRMKSTRTALKSSKRNEKRCLLWLKPRKRPCLLKKSGLRDQNLSSELKPTCSLASAKASWKS